MPKIEIAIPCYNHGRFLRQCVANVLGQGAEMRVLIVDNASTDGSEETARRIATEDSRVELLLRERNMGSHASFNSGIDWAESEYFMILCADDLLAPGCLGRALSVLEAKTCVALAYGGQVIWEEPSPCLSQRLLAAQSILALSLDNNLQRHCRCRTSQSEPVRLSSERQSRSKSAAFIGFAPQGLEA